MIFLRSVQNCSVILVKNGLKKAAKVVSYLKKYATRRKFFKNMQKI